MGETPDLGLVTILFGVGVGGTLLVVTVSVVLNRPRRPRSR